jgi:hypothetical protein
VFRAGLPHSPRSVSASSPVARYLALAIGIGLARA